MPRNQETKIDGDTQASLFKRVEALNSSQSGKTQIGYAVKAYDDVLSALKKAKTVIDRKVSGANATGGPHGQTIMRDYSTSVGDVWNEGDVNNNGFIFTGDGQKSYQGVTKICDFMSFPVDVTFQGQQTKTNPVVVPRPSEQKANSICLMGDRQPPYQMDRKSIQLTQTKLGTSNYVIGVGVDLSTFGVQFFNTYFPQGKDKWTHDNLKSLVATKKLYAEISIASSEISIGDKSNATVFHAMVTCDIGDNLGGTPDNQLGSIFKVWLPYPLLLLNDYKGITNVNINGKLIGTSGMTYPLESYKYNHKNGQIYDFTPKWLLNYMSFQGKLTYDMVTCDLVQDGQDRTARVRLYLAKDAATIVNGLPDNAQLYKGKYEVTRQEVIQGAVSGALPNGTFRIMIDVGHGNWRQPEYRLNRKISEALMQELERRGVGVLLIDAQSSFATPEVASILQKYKGQTDEDTYNDPEIGTVKNEIIIPKAKDYNCFVSIHCDAGKGNGAHVVYNNNVSESGAFGQKNKLLSQSIGKHLIRVMGRTGGTTGTDSYGAGVRTDLGILKVNNITGCLIECGFYDNPSQLVKLQNPVDIVQAISDGLIEWLNANMI